MSINHFIFLFLGNLFSTVLDFCNFIIRDIYGINIFIDAVVIVVHRILSSMIGKNEVEALEFFKGFVSFFLVSGGGFAIGICFGVITSLLTLKTTHVRGI